MHDSVFFGGSMVAALVAGVIALLAPCCLDVMLPALFATSFQNKGRLIAMTFLFAAGVATVILPIALGAAVLLRLINTGHTPLYVAGGLVMLGLGAYTLLGGKIHLPAPSRQAGGGNGPLAVYSLGLFSGVASSCCAPVLAGLIALSGLSSSLPTVCRSRIRSDCQAASRTYSWIRPPRRSRRMIVPTAAGSSSSSRGRGTCCARL